MQIHDGSLATSQKTTVRAIANALDRAGLANGVLHVEDFAEHEFSQTISFSVRTSSETSRYLLKRPKLNDLTGKSASDAAAEYRTLSHLYGLFAEVAGCAVPRPIQYLPELDAIVMERYDAGLLQDELRYLRRFTSAQRYAALCDHMHKCGLWLRTLLGFSGTRMTSGQSLLPLRQFFEIRLERLAYAARSKLLPSNFDAEIMGQLNAYLVGLTDMQIPVSWQHGDFGPWNVLAADESIVVLDFTMYGDGPPCNDLLGTLVFLDSQRSNPFLSQRRIDTLIEHFIRGYGRMPHVPPLLRNLSEFQRHFTRLVQAVLFPQHWRFQFLADSAVRYQLKWLYDVERRSYVGSRVPSIASIP